MFYFKFNIQNKFLLIKIHSFNQHLSLIKNLA